MSDTSTHTLTVCAETLNAHIEFDVPFRVTETSHIDPENSSRAAYLIDVEIETALAGVYAPNYLDDQVSDSAWTTWSDGYTGQHGYNGPVMHDSEQLRGRIALDLLSEPGTYVLVCADWTDEATDDEEPRDNDDSEISSEGWVILQLTASL